MFRRTVDELVRPWTGSKVDRVAGIEARGFILGGAIAHQLAAGFVPIRKKGKLPHETVRVAYSLEYGLDEIEMHRDGVARGERIILVDDLIATGGTAEAAVKLLRSLGAADPGRLLRHRPAGPRRLPPPAGAGRAGAHACRFSGTLRPAHARRRCSGPGTLLSSHPGLRRRAAGIMRAVPVPSARPI